MVYKAILKKRQGVEMFDTRDVLESNEANQVVAVKKLQGATFAMIFVVDYEGVWVQGGRIEIPCFYEITVKTEGVKRFRKELRKKLEHFVPTTDNMV